MDMKKLQEDRGKLIAKLEAEIKKNLKDYSPDKADKLNEEIDHIGMQIKLLGDDNVKLSESLSKGSKGFAPQMRIHQSPEILESGRNGDLEQFVSDIIKSEFGLGGEKRDLLGSSTSGQYAVPEPLATSFFSYLIERSLLGRLGIPSVGVISDTTKYAQISDLPTGDIIGEGSELTETDAEITPRTMTTYTFRAGSIISQELAEDAISSPNIFLEPIMQTIAQHIDNMLVNGSGSSEMFGVNNVPGLCVRYSMGTNDGAAITGYEELGLLFRKLREKNFDTTAFLMAVRTFVNYKLLEDAYEAPKENPFSEIPMIESNQVSITQTQGSSNVASSIVGGDFKRGVIAGWRYAGAHTKFIVDRTTLAEFGKIRLYGYCRMGFMYPYGGSAFGRIHGILNSTEGLIT